jgi:SNF2 family DNA or RNA helicase|nr:MAG TPA: Chromatin remodeling complex ATPase [Caudoviricetes sp.]
MIKLKFDFSQKLKYKQSLYIKGDYNPTILDTIHSFQTRYYHRNSKLWECKIDYFPIILDKLKFEDVQICGEIPKKFEKYLKLLNVYDTQDASYNSKTKPFDHQMDSFKYALTHNKFLLGDEQGLGKTKQALDIAVSRKSKMRHCLIVCGVNNLKWNWYKEVEIHTNEKAHILGSRVNRKGKTVIGNSSERLTDLKQVHDEYFIITNIETLRDKGIQAQIKKMCSEGIIGMTIIDEIHKCKNSQSKQGKAIHCCCSYYRLALTGTPLMNNPIDLYNVLKWLEVENHSLSYFKNLYCEMGGFGGYEIIGYKNLEQLESMLSKNMLRRRKEDVLNLPPKIYTDELLDMDNSQDKLYRDVTNQIIEDIDRIMLLPNPLTELIRLRQVTSNPNILSSKNITNVKYDRVFDILESTTDKVIIFSNWTQVINPLYIKLGSLGYNPAIVTGETKGPIEEMNKFQNDKSCRVILGTTPALGTGYTLTAANTVIFVDEPWNKAIKDQAEDRCHRIGTKGTVNIITLICKDTIDEKIHQIIKDKGELSDRIVDGIAVKPSDIKFLIGV